MRKAITVVVIVAVGLLLRLHFQQERERAAEDGEITQFAAGTEDLRVERDESQSSRFETEEAASSESRSCDGRKRCSHMSSCAEATWFLENCPGMEMDGDNDGIPCEDQHCAHR